MPSTQLLVGSYMQIVPSTPAVRQPDITPTGRWPMSAISCQPGTMPNVVGLTLAGSGNVTAGRTASQGQLTAVGSGGALGDVETDGEAGGELNAPFGVDGPFDWETAQAAVAVSRTAPREPMRAGRNRRRRRCGRASGMRGVAMPDTTSLEPSAQTRSISRSMSADWTAECGIQVPEPTPAPTGRATGAGSGAGASV